MPRLQIILEHTFAAFLLVTLLASALAVPDEYNFSQRMNTFTEIIDSVLQNVETIVIKMAKSVLDATMAVMGAVYAPMVVLGVLLYTTRLNKYRGKDLIYGALLLAFFAEFVMPTLLG